MRELLLLSSTRVFGKEPLEYCRETVSDFWGDIRELVFIPFASTRWDGYTDWVKQHLEPLGFRVKGIHEGIEAGREPKQILAEADGVFVGGGNTFLLLHTLYKYQLIAPVHQRVLAGELKYMGSSAGSNLACPTIKTTNDMPIIFPPSFEAFHLVPFNINPHYIDPEPNSKHMGETRQQRIKEFHEINQVDVVGLREGAYLKVAGNHCQLGGVFGAKIFRENGEIEVYEPGADLSFLMAAE